MLKSKAGNAEYKIWPQAMILCHTQRATSSLIKTQQDKQVSRSAPVVSSATPDHRESLNLSEADNCLPCPAKQPDAAQEKLHPGSAPRHLGTGSMSGPEKRLRELGSICQHTERPDQRVSV